MKDPKHIHISDYNYDLPDSRIAKYPLAERDASKLLIYNHGKVEPKRDGSHHRGVLYGTVQTH